MRHPEPMGGNGDTAGWRAYGRWVPLRTNKEIEDAAIGWVIELERQAGRLAADVRHTGHAADLSSPPRSIEIKAYGGSARGQELWLETRQIDEAHSNPDFWLYLVENIRQGDPGEFRSSGSAVMTSLRSSSEPPSAATTRFHSPLPATTG